MKKEIQKVILSILLYIIAILVPANFIIIKIAMYLIAYLVAGYDVMIKAIKDIRNKEPFGECLLMTIATLGAFGAGIYHTFNPVGDGFPEEYAESVAVMLFYQVGELFQSYAVGKSRKSIADLMDIRPDYAMVFRKDILEKVDPFDVEMGEIILVSPGEKVPLDGEVIKGEAMVDTSALTGESVPRRLYMGSEALSGFINKNGVIHIKVTKEFGESTASKILELVENAATYKAKTERFITKFARIYTPIVVFLALGVAVIPPLFTREWLIWCMRALNFLIVSCPCALVVSVPLSFFGGIGGASKKGILIKGSNYFEQLAKAKIVVFDKTGTLTEGKFCVQNIMPVGISKEELLWIANYGESYSHHPIAISIKEAWEQIKERGEKFHQPNISDIREISGYGIELYLDGKEILIGNAKLMELHGIRIQEAKEMATIVYIAMEGEYKGYLSIADKIKEDAKQGISDLRAVGIQKTIMLTGDRKDIGEEVAKALGMDEVYTDLLPHNKVEQVEKFLQKKKNTESLLFVGDGINDAPVLARADVGIAMGGIGSDAAVEAADVVIMRDEPSKIAMAIKISKKTVNIAMQNIIGAILVKVVILILSALGIANMWMAVFGDVGVTVIAILNSFRALYTENL